METTLNHKTEPRIYVACLAAYNNGYLHGAWINAAQEPWAIYDAVRVMLAASPIAGAEEWAIHDYEGFGGIRIEEYTSFDRLSALASFLAEHGVMGAALLEHYCGDLDEAREALADRYLGEHPSLADYVQEVTEETTAIPQPLRYYIDYAAMARDAELNGDLFTVSTAWDAVHVFAGC
ncbi:MAG: antirestriction protein ArdA [Sphingomonas sp.]|jgi:antirestriction protein|uniref:antirestriction protein ArdA n=1 Tax=Sphingomonadaceae TaxID=41297 RepID=UPI0006C8AC3E|nr:antirestriction protein ArdA [Novosphingobium sp. ST904]KPH62290.1 antirestriction protein [Novosphingobium sp. ST904]MBY0304072.1 antirestriction protein ArdA [Sphingomonas sp.]TCM43377.1 antirestriction protein [Novosphingobium sp. ST904]